MGYVYRPKLKKRSGETEARQSAVWWVKYYAAGNPVRESTGTENREEARRFLKTREGAVATGAPILPRVDRVRYDELATDLEAHYAATGKRNLREAKFRLAHLTKCFTGRRAVSIGPTEITRYAVQRQVAGAANATINRELATLSRMLRLGYGAGKVLRPPVIERLKEAAPRQGFFEREQFLAVRKRLPDDLQAVVTIAYTFGWRTPSEVLPLERRQLDLEAGTLRLDPGATKNDEGRVVYLTSELKAVLGAQVERVRTLEKRLGRIIPFLFPHLDGDELGRRRIDIRSAWKTACKNAGVPGRIPHDFRRTAVRNLERAGVPRSVAMKITGHKTEAVYRRYAIVSDADLREASQRLAGTFSGTSDSHAGSSRDLTVRS
jgi:integrase